MLTIPRMPAGTLTGHDRDILHGVTRMTEGVRYSLFVVDGSNGLGESKKDMKVIDGEVVRAMKWVMNIKK